MLTKQGSESKARACARGGSAPARGGHAVVIGGSVAGLLAARVLCEYFECVTVVERDSFPVGAPDARKGVPQAHHVHALMLRGRAVFEKFFPGIERELLAAGAVLVDMAGEMAWLTPAGWGVRFPSDLTVIGFTRPLLDFHVRRRLGEFKQVRVLENTETVRLIPSATGDSVAGVIVRERQRGPGACGGEVELRADLVVDASGRGSRAPRWLAELGYPAPEETVVNAFLGYASRLYRTPAGRSAGHKGAYVQAAPPHRTRGGIYLPVEGGRLLVTLTGAGRDYPPMDDAGFLAFARGLADPIIYDAIKEAEPLSPVRSYRATENRLRRYERLARQPANFFVTGDAACAFNPVYGQGMTIAALGALALGETLEVQKQRHTDGSCEGLSRRFQKRLARVNSAPWLMATGEDFRYRETEGGAPTAATRLMHRYMDGVVRLTTTDERVRRVMLENVHMLRRPASLLHPRIALRLLRQGLSRDGARAHACTPAQLTGEA